MQGELEYSVLKHSVPIKTVPQFPSNSGDIVSWWNSMSSFALLAERGNENIKYLFHFTYWESNPQPSSKQSHASGPAQ